MPTLALGIPGSPSTAVLLAGLIHGTFPGRQLMTEDLHIVFALIGAMVLSNILTSTIGVAAAPVLSKITMINTGLLVPVILVITVMGAFGVRNNFGDVMLALVCGLLGYVMLRFGYSRVPVIIGLILGALVERSYNTSMQISRGDASVFFTRPLSQVFLAAMVLTMLLPAYQALSTRRKIARTATVEEREPVP